MPSTRTPARSALLGAFAAVYFVWGSTYLAMRIGVRTMPPFLLGASRFFLAGALLWGYHVFRGQSHLAKGHWKESIITGLLLLVGGNGAVVWSLQYIPSGLAALVVGSVPLWIVGIEWLQGKRTPTLRTMAGLLAGLIGMVVLLGPDIATAMHRHDHSASRHALGLMAVLGASLSWSLGSLRSRRTSIPSAPFLAAGMQTLSGGAALLLLSGAAGEWHNFHPYLVSAAAIGAVAYLVLFGSLLAFSAYIWLLQVAPPARVATYAFVNPVVAVLLGSVVLGEELTTRTLVSAAIIVAAVALITTTPRPPTR